MILYSYWRSTTAYRVRIALAMKGLEVEIRPIDLVAGEQNSGAYATVNPGQGVPCLELADGQRLSQSLAILDWLDETHSVPALLPADPWQRAKARAAALVIATDIHPINNLRVVERVKALGASQEQAVDWMRYWMARGFEAFQAQIEPNGAYCFGDKPGLADICLVPQLYNARRWDMDLSPFDRLVEIEQRCLALPAFQAAHPDQQPDAPR